MTRTIRRRIEVEERRLDDNMVTVVTNIAPKDTWFTTNSGDTRAISTLHEWTIDSLASPTANAKIEGDDITTTALTAPTRANNYAQIIEKDLRLSDTQNRGVKSAGSVNTIDYQKNKKLTELARDIEYALLINTAAASGASGTARTTKGVLGWLTTNISSGSATGIQLTEAILSANLQAIWAQGGHPSTVLCGGYQKRKISGFTTNTRNITADERKLTAAVDVYESDFGMIRIVPSTIMNSAAADQLIVLGDMSLWNKAWVQPIYWQDLARTGMSQAMFVAAEVALESRQQAGSGKVISLATA